MNDAAKYIMALQFTVVGVLTLIVVGAVVNISEDGSTNNPQPGSSQLQVAPSANGQSLQVRESFGDPEPLNTPIQGARGNAQQEAAGELQQPRTVDELQPNAKLDDFPENL